MVVPLFICRNAREIGVYLARQGVVGADPIADSFGDEADGDDWDRTEREELVEGAFADMFTDIMGRATAVTPELPRASPLLQPPVVPPPAPPPQAFALPPLDEVNPAVRELKGTTIEPRAGGSQGQGYSYSSFQPPTPADVERDYMVGRRGEEIVYELELKRVRELGHERPEDHVVWTSQADAGADHDIRSIDDLGRMIWIEVKSTTGSDGRFIWPRREFEKAVAAGDRYELCRVYHVAGTSPQVKRFRNPVGLLSSRQIFLDLNELKANVEPL
ncbi:DUF3883 domain-containing protein [Mesorhizobium sp. CN2-181]